MRIQIYKETPLANAPDELCYAINKWTEHEAFLSNRQDETADFILFNNRYFKTDIHAAIWYHSEPTWKDLMLDCPYDKLTNAQYHMTLPEYRGCIPVRNVISFDKPEYEYNPVKELKIAFSPSSKKNVGRYHHKGYEETVEALSGYNSDVITDTPLHECLARKNACSVVIDEVVTGSYHRSALEGLAMGKVVICHINKKLRDKLSCTWGNMWSIRGGGRCLPIIDATLEDLDKKLALLDCMDLESIGYYNRLWMIKHWHPRDIANEFIDIFKGVIDAK